MYYFDSEELPAEWQMRHFILEDAKYEDKQNRRQPPIYLNRKSRCWIWRVCKYLKLRKHGVAGEACRILEFYLGEKIHVFMNTEPSEEQYNQYRQDLDKDFPLYVSAAIIVATQLFCIKRIITAEMAAKCLEAHGCHEYTSLQISQTMCDIINSHEFRFPVYSTVQIAKYVLKYANISPRAYRLIQMLTDMAEFMRFRIDADLRESSEYNIFDDYRVITLDLAAVSAYITARHLGYETPSALPQLAELTSTSTSYLSNLSNLLLHYVEFENIE